MDLDGSGDISFEEFVMMMRLGGMETDYEKEINGAFAFFDKNNDGQVCRLLLLFLFLCLFFVVLMGWW